MITYNTRKDISSNALSQDLGYYCMPISIHSSRLPLQTGEKEVARHVRVSYENSTNGCTYSCILRNQPDSLG
jgi:hypothetical protein